MEQALKTLFLEHFGGPCERIQPIEAHASSRRIFRLSGEVGSAIGVYNRNRRENLAFLSFSRHFRREGLNVPEIFGENPDEYIYLEEDLGDQTLMSFLQSKRSAVDPFPVEVENYYQKALKELVRFQVPAGEGVNYSLCFSGSHFGPSGMLYDLEQFKKWFLGGAKISFDEPGLNRDFEGLAQYLGAAPSDYFLYRDFQARNIMIKTGELFFIDYQGGRKGPLQWDVASLLYQSSAKLPDSARERLLNYYLNCLDPYIELDRAKFREFYSGFVLLRMLQAMGTYGREGLIGGKEYFIQSIAPAALNIKTVLESGVLKGTLPVLANVLSDIIKRFGPKTDA